MESLDCEFDEFQLSWQMCPATRTGVHHQTARSLHVRGLTNRGLQQQTGPPLTLRHFELSFCMSVISSTQTHTHTHTHTHSHTHTHAHTYTHTRTHIHTPAHTYTCSTLPPHGRTTPWTCVPPFAVAFLDTCKHTRILTYT